MNSVGPSDSGARQARLSPSELMLKLRALASDQSHQSIAQRVAGAAFIMRVASAVLVYFSQVLFARWMGKFEFGVYVYVWTWLLLLGAFMPLGLSSTAQRFIPEYKARGDFARLRGFLVA
ncbi:MAG TPA: flippase, partial [Xanthobacteraceae bacterium]|nr:flippase [Xanthobacteraceae bacterium]